MLRAWMHRLQVRNLWRKLFPRLAHSAFIMHVCRVVGIATLGGWRSRTKNRFIFKQGFPFFFLGLCACTLSLPIPLSVDPATVRVLTEETFCSLLGIFSERLNLLYFLFSCLSCVLVGLIGQWCQIGSLSGDFWG